MPLNSFGERGNYIFQLTNYYKTPINDLFSIQKSLCFYFRYLFATFGLYKKTAKKLAVFFVFIIHIEGIQSDQV